jgi:hypothetical protein
MLDWKDENSYPKELPLEGWAWEFLRRNKEYRQDYADWLALESHQATASSASFLLSYAEVRKREEDRKITKYDPPRGEDESFDDWEQRCRSEGRIPRTFTLTEWIQYRWRLARPANPDLAWDGADVRFLPPEFPARVGPDDFENYFEEHFDNGVEVAMSYTVPKDGSVVIAFDVKRPLPPQLTAAEKMLKKLAQELSQVHPKAKKQVTNREAANYRNQLRVLDALAAGATLKEIAACLFPEDLDKFDPLHGEKHVQDVKESAQKMVDGGYRRLLLWGPE